MSFSLVYMSCGFGGLVSAIFKNCVNPTISVNPRMMDDVILHICVHLNEMRSVEAALKRE